MSYSWGWPTNAWREKETKVNEETTPPNVSEREVGWYRRMSKRQRRWFWVGTVLAVLIMLGQVRGPGSSVTRSNPASGVQSPTTSQAAPGTVPPQQSPAPMAAPVPPVDSKPLTTFSDGTYLVGEDIEPGTYKTNGADPDNIIPSAYWARSKDDSGSIGSIIANDLFKGPARITVKKGEYLKVSGGAVWVKVK